MDTPFLNHFRLFTIGADAQAMEKVSVASKFSVTPFILPPGLAVDARNGNGDRVAPEQIQEPPHL